MESLILQRMRIDRTRAQGRWMLAIGVAWFVLSVFSIIDDPARLSGWGFAGVAAGWIVVGTRNLRKYSAQVSAFEREHGANAGKQEPIQMPRRARTRKRIPTETRSESWSP